MSTKQMGIQIWTDPRREARLQIEIKVVNDTKAEGKSRERPRECQFEAGKQRRQVGNSNNVWGGLDRKSVV